MKQQQFRINRHGALNKARTLAFYAIISGSAMLSIWIFCLVSGKIPEFTSRSAEMSFHFAVEICTAIMLLINGLRVLISKGNGEGLLLVSVGMLFYSLLNTAGYFAERSITALMVFCILMLVVTICITINAFHGK